MQGFTARLRANETRVVAYLALFVALGGVSYAAINLPAKSVGTKHLKRNAVVSSKVKNGSLSRADFRAGQIPTGPSGPAGPSGPTGPTGPPGPTGPAGSPDTPTQVRDKLLQADGPTSGVDADQLDGIDSEGFVREIYSHSQTWDPPILASGSCDFTVAPLPSALADTILPSDSLVVSAYDLNAYVLQLTGEILTEPKYVTRGLYAYLCNNGQFGAIDRGSFTVSFRVLR